MQRDPGKIIFHLAAHAYLDGSYEYPADIFEVNVMGTVGLLEAVRRSGRIIPVVVVSFVKAFPNVRYPHNTSSTYCHGRMKLGLRWKQFAAVGA